MFQDSAAGGRSLLQGTCQRGHRDVSCLEWPLAGLGGIPLAGIWVRQAGVSIPD